MARRPALRLGSMLAAVLALVMWAPRLGAADDPVVLPAMSVVESLMKVNVITSYQQFRLGEPSAVSMQVRNVKESSFAYESGIRKGMEIVAINGKKIAGLTPGQVDRLLSEPRKDEVVLLVQGKGIKTPKEIRISLKPPVEEIPADEKK